MVALSDQCAAADGSHLDASEIVFYNDPDDDTPLPNSNSASQSHFYHIFLTVSSSHVVQLQPSYVLLIFTYIYGTQYSIPFLILSFGMTPPQCLTTTEV
jgi:hypothetical protein